MNKEVVFDNHLLWFGLIVGCVAFYFFSAEGQHPVLTAVLALTAGLGAQIVLTAFLIPVAWYQLWRVQHALPRSHAAALLVGSLVLGAALDALFAYAMGFELINTLWGLFTLLTLPFVLVGAYTEIVARRKMKFVDLSRSRDMQLK